jgi:hypothetical protein
MAEVLHSTDSESSPIKRGPKKIIANEISLYIETLWLMVLFLMNDRIKAKVQGWWPGLEVSHNTIRDARVNLGFRFRPAMIKRDFSPEQRFPYGLDTLAKNFDPATVIFSDEMKNRECQNRGGVCVEQR